MLGTTKGKKSFVVLFENKIIFISKFFKEMNIISTDKIELNYNSYDNIFTMSIYDKYGHYVDEIGFIPDELSDIYDRLKQAKESGII